MKKKILFIITKATWGGAQRYVYDLATHLPREQFSVVVTYGEKGKLSNDLAKTPIETRQLPFLGRDIAVISDIKSFFEIWKCIRSERPDVVHLNSSKAAALGALAARLAGVPKIIFTVHGWPFKERRNELSRMLIYAISWFTAALSHITVVVSKSDEAIALRMPVVRKKIRYVPIGIEPPEFLGRDAAKRALPKYGFTKPIYSRVVTIAELTANKGIRYAIEAMALLKERDVGVDYFIIGDGEERAELVERARRLNVADRVHFLGFVENAARYLKAFDVFLLPSIKEGMPYVLLEGGAAGLRIVSTTVVDPAFLGTSVFDVVHVRPGDPQAIADALQSALLDENELSLPFVAPLSEMVRKTIALY